MTLAFECIQDFLGWVPWGQPNLFFRSQSYPFSPFQSDDWTDSDRTSYNYVNERCLYGCDRPCQGIALRSLAVAIA